MMEADATHYRTCPLCEATCGLAIEVETTTETSGDAPGTVKSVRGDAADVFSKGYLCTKGLALGDLHADPDRLRVPLIRDRSTHEFRKATWREAFAHAAQGLQGVIDRHGREALAIYLGNPNTHNPGLYFYSPALIRAMRTRHIFSASSVDQLPKQLSSALLFGLPSNIAVPDIDRCDYLLMLGANPFVSNGSLWTAPDIPGRVRALKERGGQLIVVDPVRTITAKNATEHIAIRPGGDAYLLAAIAQTLFAESLVQPGRAGDYIHERDMQRFAEAIVEYTPEAVLPRTGIAPERVRGLARELVALRAEGKAGAVYSRIGSCTQEFGTLANWLVDVINILTGNLDEPGGAMFPRPAAAMPNHRPATGKEKGYRPSKKISRVRGLPIVFGESPASCLPDEILTEGRGQIRALFTLAGNPAVSTPDSARVQAAFDDLEFMISVDMYLTETTRRADVIFPALSHLEDSHFDFIFSQFMVRNIAKYSPAVFARPDDQLYEWEVLLRLAAVVSGSSPDGYENVDLQALDTTVLRQWISQLGDRPANLEVDDLVPMLDGEIGPDRITDYLLRSGPYGAGFGPRAEHQEALSLAKLKEHPHGVDLGALEPRLHKLLRTASQGIEIAPDILMDDLDRLRAGLRLNPAKSSAASGGQADYPLLLIGRRHIKSNNSWMHNIERLAKGPERTALYLHPADAQRLGIENGNAVEVTSRVGQLATTAHVTDTILSGVVSLPHGWSGPASANHGAHNAGAADSGARPGMRVAERYPGVNTNLLTDPELYDRPSGNAVLDGIPVRVRAL